MVDVFNSAKRSWVMSRVRSKDTLPELVVANALKRGGIRFQKHRKDLPGCPDLVIARHRLAIFVNGCFWHWHGCSRCKMPEANRHFWRTKFNENVARDKRSRMALHRLGWHYVTIWECNLRDGLKRCFSAIRRSSPLA